VRFLVSMCSLSWYACGSYGSSLPLVSWFLVDFEIVDIGINWSGDLPYYDLIWIEVEYIFLNEVYVNVFVEVEHSVLRKGDGL
jgi:hypothetical protein